MLMQNFGVTNKEYYGMLWYFLEWSIGPIGSWSKGVFELRMSTGSEDFSILMIPREKLQVINVPLGRAFVKKKKKRRKHFRLKVLHDLLLQQTGLQGFKSNTSIIFGNSPLLACAWFSYFLPPTKALLAWFHFWLVLQHTIVPKSVLQPNLSYIIIFLFAYCHWDLGLIRSDPGLFPQDSTYPHKKLGLYDNENVRVLVFNIDWVFV